MLRLAAYFAAGRSSLSFAQAVAQAACVFFMCAYEQTRSTQVKLLGTPFALLVEIQRKLKYVQLGAACGPRPAARCLRTAACGLRQSMNQSSQLVLLFERPAAMYELAFSLDVVRSLP